ncbi:UAA transporter [Nadsonia fulvescens var. elongata DSM 6958]|uniref:UAA transporter n=1 Tax=Nadsonia fulvescens var. elongata DSM 6958 TaxID=857566 RepID=A0A1E3PHM0_9ASCO|nr:UAA transporter [Nadsonia fulvescens var. elongata DSM 6958]
MSNGLELRRRKHDESINEAQNNKRKPRIDDVSKPFIHWISIFSLIFGGCCSNVFTLESIVNEQPVSGNLITFSQFLFISIEGYIHFFDFNSPFFLKKPKVPLYRWGLSTILFFLVSVLNNYVWAYNISVPFHIIFRSGGALLTLLFGYFSGSKYTFKQVVSVVVLTIGVIIATFSNDPGENPNDSENPDKYNFFIGVSTLFLASLLSPLMGMIAESTYKQYGNHWRESLFYTHVLAMPLFLLMAPSLKTQFNLMKSSKNSIVISLGNLEIVLLKPFVNLVLNAISQYVCVCGVNKLAGSSSALTVTIGLNIRKLVSLLLSILIFGNTLSPGAIFGAGLVFGGAFMYSVSK